MKNFTYYRPGTIELAVTLLNDKWGPSELLAGGTITITTFAPDTGRFQVVPAHSLSSVNDQYMMWHGEGDSNVKVLTVTGVPGVSTVNMSADTSIDIGTADSPPAADV